MDRELNFQVEGNSPTPFRVTFARKGDQLAATCTCNAGRLGKLCKHRLTLMKQDPLIRELFRASSVEGPLTDLLEAEADLAAAEQAFTRKKELFLALVTT